jgi:glycosyltransferase involved in cell wall biosynthesis
LKRITFLGPAWPYRGGIATIIERLAGVFASRGARVNILTFSVQYPRWLFPGKSQYRTTAAPDGLHIERVVNTANPFNWLRVGLRLRREAPDAVILKYWTPFMAPCFGTIARVAKWGRGGRGGRGDKTARRPKFLVQLDNIVPHERRWFDGPLTRYFVGAMDGFIYMSESVGRELAEFDTRKPRLYSPHPIFDHFGAPLSRDDAAARLGLDPRDEYTLFFGLVRPYKGLDMLIDAWAKTDGVVTNPHFPRRKLLIAGEFYDDVEKYRAQVSRLGLENEVVIHDRFVGDDEIPAWFSLADLLVLPYRSATQSGVTQIALHFGVPMVVTDVGGLPEIVHDGETGFVAPPTVEGLVGALEKVWTPGTTSALRANFAAARQRFGWPAAAAALEKLYEALK